VGEDGVEDRALEPSLSLTMTICRTVAVVGGSRDVEAGKLA